MECTCGRQPNKKDIDDALDTIFGKDTSTVEERDQYYIDQIVRDEKALQEKKEYLIVNGVDILPLSKKEIYKAFDKCVRDNMTDEEKSKPVYTKNYNILRIMFDKPAIVFNG